MRIHKTTFWVFSQKMQDLGIDDSDVEMETEFDMDRVERVSQWMPDKGSSAEDVYTDRCMVYMYGHESILISTPYEEMLKLWKGGK